MFKPSVQQQAIFDELAKPDCGSLIIEAKAGSGKTTTIVEAAKLMKGSIFLGAFNRSMADELIERCENISNTTCETFHAIGRRALSNHSQFGFLKTDTRKVTKLIKQINFASLRDPMYERDAWKIAKLISMAKNRGIGVLEPNTIDYWYDMIEHHTLDDSLDERFDDQEEMKNLILFCQDILKHDIEFSTDIDFDDMLYLPLYHNTPLPQFDWVMIDEAQDTNRVRRELARRMLKPDGRLVAVGDPNQAIYGFTGADNDALTRIKNQFNAKVMPLSVSYRCPTKIISLAQAYVPDIDACETAKEGFLDNIKYSDVVDHVKPGEVILSRFNKYLVNLCFKFLRKGIPAKIVGRDIGTNLISLANTWKTQDFEKLRDNLIKWEAKEIKRALNKGTDNTDYISDRAESVRIMIDRAIELGYSTKNEMISMIEEMFDDNAANNKNIVILCSVHRAKGLEWDNIYLIGRKQIMGRIGNNEWQREQELNLIYVAITRAKNKFVDVTNVPMKF